jgi:excinuclease ABC subunit C
MHEVVLRRYRRVLEQGGPFPDLIVVDGGKGQLSAAYAALREIGLDRLIAVGIAKQEELLFTRDRVEGMALPRESAGLRLIQRIRDEAHRFAVTFHRQSRRKRDLRSNWTTSPASAPASAGSCDDVRIGRRRSPGEPRELQAAVGPKAAEAVIRHYAGQG